MARVVRSKKTDTGGAFQTSITPITAVHSANNAILIHVSFALSGKTIQSSDGSWTKLQEQNSGAGNITTALFYKVAASSSETMPTFSCTDSSSREWLAVVHVVEDNATTSVINQSGATSTGLVTNYTVGSITTSVDNCLVLHFISSPNDVLRWKFPPQINQIGNHDDADVLAQMTGWTTKVTAGATDTFEVFTTFTTAQAITISVAIADSGTTAEPCIDPSTNNISLIFAMGQVVASHYNCNGVADPTGKFVSTPYPDGLTPTYKALGVGGFPIGDINANPGDAVYIRPVLADKDKLMVGEVLLDTSVSIDNGIITALIGAAQSGVNLAPFDAGGAFLGFSDGTNISLWKVSCLDTEPSITNGPHPVWIDTSTTPYYTSGTLNKGAVTGIILGAVQTADLLAFQCSTIWHVANTSGATVPFIGGSNARPLNLETLIPPSKTGGASCSVYQRKMATGQAVIGWPFQIGNGTDKTVAKFSNQTGSFARSYTESELFLAHNIPTGGTPLVVYASANDTIDFSSYTHFFGEYQPFIEHASSSASATYNYNGFTLLQPDVTLNITGLDRTGMTISGGKEVTHNGQSLSGVTLSGVASGETAYVTVTSEAQFAAVVTGATFRNNTNAPAIRITGDQTGSWSDPGLTVSGNTVDIEYTGTTAFSIQSAVPLTVNSTVTPGLLTVVTPTQALVINPDVTITGAIRYFDGSPDDQTPNDSGTGDSLSYTYSTTDPIDIEVVEQYYVPVNQQDVTPFNGTRDIEMDFDEAYNDSHGLSVTTDFTYTRATKVLNILADQNAFDVRSALADTIRTNSSYFNTKLLMVAIPGLARIDQTAGMTVADMSTWKRAGSEVFDAADSTNPVKKYFAIQTVGTITGATTHCRQTSSGDSTAVTLTNNIVDESFLYYEDADHDGTPSSDLSGYMLIKSFLAGSKQGRVDVLANAGISALQSTLYVVPLSNTAHDYAGTDPGISADITIVTGGTVGGKTFAYKIVDGGTNTGANIAAQLNYNAAANPNAVIPGGTGLRYFELPDMVIHNATAVETERGFREGATPTLVGFYVERGGADHPDFTRFQADDGTYYVPAVTANGTVTNLPDDVGGVTRLQIYNVTTATEYYSGDPAGTGYSASYTDGVGITSGDSLRLRFAHVNGSNSFEYGETFTVASTSGFSVDGNNFIGADDVYASNAVDGSAVTKFVADFVNDEIDLAVNANFEAKEAYAYYCYTLTLAQGIEEFWGGVTAQDVGNYRINASVVSIYFDNTTTASKRQTDSARIYRSDGAYPVKDPTTSGFGIDVNWQNVVYVTTVTGSNVITGNITDVAAQVQSALTAQGYTTTRAPYIDAIKTKTDQLTFTTPNVVDASASVSEASIRSAIGMASANLDTQLATITADTNELQTNQGNWLTATGFATTNPDNASIAEILTDTGTTIPAIIAALNNLSSADVTASVPTVAEITTAIDALLTTDAIAEPTSPPAANAPLTQKIAWIFAMARNRIEQTETQQIIRADDGVTAIGTASATDDGTTAVRGEFG